MRRLRDVGLALLVDRGRSDAVRVADIVAAAGLSNKAFYRYFASKDDLVAAIVDDGVRRAESYLRHHISKESSPERRLQVLIDRFLHQVTDPTIAAAARAVLAQPARSRDTSVCSTQRSMDMITRLAIGPLAELGIAEPQSRARLFAITLSGAVQDLLWQSHPRCRPPYVADVTDFCLAGAGVTAAIAAATAAPPGPGHPSPGPPAPHP